VELCSQSARSDSVEMCTVQATENCKTTRKDFAFHAASSGMQSVCVREYLLYAQRISCLGFVSADDSRVPQLQGMPSLNKLHTTTRFLASCDV